MPGTYSQILLHVVFSTKRRDPWITTEIANRLYPYIGGIIRSEKGVLHDIGGVADHVHLYLRWRPDATISDLMRTVKARSSKWVHDNYSSLEGFAWQEGYGVFTVSKSREPAIKKYIAEQHEHHQKEDFKSELLRFLRDHEIEFDEKYVFDKFGKFVEEFCVVLKAFRQSAAGMSHRSTGCASPTGKNEFRRDGSSTGFTSFHPWLQSDAPFGAQNQCQIGSTGFTRDYNPTPRSGLKTDRLKNFFVQPRMGRRVVATGETRGTPRCARLPRLMRSLPIHPSPFMEI